MSCDIHLVFLHVTICALSWLLKFVNDRGRTDKIIIKQRRRWRAEQSGDLFFPMGADDQNSVRLSQTGWEPAHEINHRLVAGISKNRQGTSPVGEIDNLNSTVAIGLMQ